MPHRDARPPSQDHLHTGATSSGNPVRRQRIYIGEVVASATPLLLETLLGSCVAVCLRDPAVCVGGMNHILLPGRCPTDSDPRCGPQAMDFLIERVVALGAHPQRLVAKVFGAGNVVAALQAPTIGDLNAAFVRDYLANVKIPVLAERLGGNHPVHVRFRTDTGWAEVRSVDGSRLPEILVAEAAYEFALANGCNGPRQGAL